MQYYMVLLRKSQGNLYRYLNEQPPYRSIESDHLSQRKYLDSEDKCCRAQDRVVPHGDLCSALYVCLGPLFVRLVCRNPGPVDAT